MFFESTQWNKEKGDREFRPEFSHVKAFTQDGSDYVAWLYTKPDFGCVMHEKKP